MIDYIPAELLLPPSSFLLPASLGPIPILELTPPSSLKKSPLSFHALMWSPFCNPFAFKFMHVMGVYCPPRCSDLQTSRRVFNLSPFFSILSGHSYTTAAHQPFCNQTRTPPVAMKSGRNELIAKGLMSGRCVGVSRKN